MQSKGRVAPLRRASRLLAGLVACGAGMAATASPMTYTGTVFTDITFAGVNYHNADVTITFVGDSLNIYPFNAADANGWVGSGLWLKEGRATLSFESNGKTITADFLPGQIYVSVDSANGGIGFGSQYGPVYPLGLDDGTADWWFYGFTDLTTPVNVTGFAWSCIGFPVFDAAGTGLCSDPQPLHTTKGDLYVGQPYNYYQYGQLCGDHCGALNRGTFSVIRGARTGD